MKLDEKAVALGTYEARWRRYLQLVHAFARSGPVSDEVSSWCFRMARRGA